MRHPPLPSPQDSGPEPARPGDYRTTLGDRHGPDTGLLLRCASWGLYVFGVALFGGALAGGLSGMFLFGAGGAVVGLLVSWAAWSFSGAAAAGFRAFIQPSGASTPYQASYSYEESLAARGDVAGAVEAYERRMAEQPFDVEVRVRAAELLAGEGNDPARAAAVFRELRAIPGVAPERVLYATQRLIDLHRGPLADDGRALVELRRLVETFPRSTAARHAREAIRKMKGAVRGDQ